MDGHLKSATLVWGAAVVVVVVLAMAIVDCSHPQPARSMATISVPVCEAIAMAHGRPDFAKLCRVGGDLAPLIDDLLAENQMLRACRPAGQDGGVPSDAAVSDAQRDAARD
jgi:hypothetical protein